MYSWQRCSFDSAWLYIKPHTQQYGEKNCVKSPLFFYFKKELGLAWTIPHTNILYNILLKQHMYIALCFMELPFYS